MKQTTLFIFCLLAMVLGVESAASQVTRADYERADTILKCSIGFILPLSIPNG